MDSNEARRATGATGPAANQSPAPDAVLGVYCRRSHFNDPEMAYCTVCGISMAQNHRKLAWGTRPSLGVLVLDDGTTFSLTKDHVFGRMPETDEAVRAGRAEPVRLPDSSVSRIHARIVLEGWAVRLVDSGSTNGTFLWAPGASSWTRVPRGAGTVLRTGVMVAIGQRLLRYHSHRAQSEDFSNLESIWTAGNNASSTARPGAQEQTAPRRAA